MPGRLKRLLSIASPPFRPSLPAMPQLLASRGELGRELYDMLGMVNGFFAFESALHVFPLGPGEDTDLETWNSVSLWRSGYGELTQGLLFFAEDSFGHQFAIRDSSIVSFNPETAEATGLASSLEDWAERILDDYEALTGYPLVHQWQQRHGPIPRDHRLTPRLPFIVGGDYSLSNLYLARSVSLMRFNASLAQQIKNLPDGVPISLKILPGGGGGPSTDTQ